MGMGITTTNPKIGINPGLSEYLGDEVRIELIVVRQSKSTKAIINTFKTFRILSHKFKVNL